MLMKILHCPGWVVLVLSIDVPGVIHMNCFSLGSSYTFQVSKVIGRNQGVGMLLCWEGTRCFNEENSVCARPQSSINLRILNSSLPSLFFYSFTSSI